LSRVVIRANGGTCSVDSVNVARGHFDSAQRDRFFTRPHPHQPVEGDITQPLRAALVHPRTEHPAQGTPCLGDQGLDEHLPATMIVTHDPDDAVLGQVEQDRMSLQRCPAPMARSCCGYSL
jgi:hypothetical protein